MGEDRTFGRYRVTRALGSGAMGEVYEAVDDVLGREVAIKTLKARGGAWASLYDDRFRHEARAIAQLSHPGIVQVFDLDLAADPPYLVLERVAGPALDARLEQGPLAAEQLVPLGIQIARALAAAHAAGIIHRDVKPGNILAAGAGGWKLADFGVAHVPESSLTITGQFVGSPAYASPEALVKGVVAPAGDVYALGATLYEAAAGTWPRLEATGALLAPVPPLAELAPGLPPALAAAIDRAVAFEPDRRPSASELAELLARAGTEPARAVLPVPGPAPAGASRWKPWAIGAGILVAVIVAAGALGGGGRGGAAPAAVGPAGRELGAPAPHPDDRAARDWQKIQEEIARGHYGAARHRLDDWERRNGTTEESQAMREQLDALGPEGDDEGGGPPHGPRKRH